MEIQCLHALQRSIEYNIQPQNLKLLLVTYDCTLSTCSMTLSRDLIYQYIITDVHVQNV